MPLKLPGHRNRDFQPVRSDKLARSIAKKIAVIEYRAAIEVVRGKELRIPTNSSGQYYLARHVVSICEI